jgi:hypothetical protein
VLLIRLCNGTLSHLQWCVFIEGDCPDFMQGRLYDLAVSACRRMSILCIVRCHGTVCKTRRLLLLLLQQQQRPPAPRAQATKAKAAAGSAL